MFSSSRTLPGTNSAATTRVRPGKAFQLFVHLPEQLEDMVGDDHDIFLPFPNGGMTTWTTFKPIEQILAEPSLSHFFRKSFCVAQTKRHIDVDRLVAPDPLNFRSCSTRKVSPGPPGNLPDLVEKQACPDGPSRTALAAAAARR